MPSNQNCNKKVEVCQRCRQNRTETRRLRCAKESARNCSACAGHARIERCAQQRNMQCTSCKVLADLYGAHNHDCPFSVSTGHDASFAMKQTKAQQPCNAASAVPGKRLLGKVKK